jgi:dUTP pyrophosphatase
MIEVQFKKLYPDVEIPEYATPGSSGFDLKVHHIKKVLNPHGADMEDIFPDDRSYESAEILPHQRVLAGCGWACAIPEGYEIQVRTRSGMALKQGIIILNAPGTIDSDYRGEMGLILHNDTPYPISIKKGDRLGQGVLVPIEKAFFKEVTELDETVRGTGGYGSTGK